MRVETNRIDPDHDALIVVDVQIDFCPGGALAVAGGNEVIGPLNRLLGLRWKFVAGTRDWHPPKHASFRTQGGPWPPHCVAGTPGAAFHPELRADRFQLVISKGASRDDPGFSPVAGTELATLLREAGVRRIMVGGLATEYCVKTAVIDLIAAGFDVTLLSDAARAIEIIPGDGVRATEEMGRAGAMIVRTESLSGLPH